MIEIKVPKEVKFISDWRQFDFSNFSDKCIIDKQIPGCGFTQWCITNSHNVILCSPRKMLLENKAEQNNNVFLVKNEFDKDPGVDKNIVKTIKISDINKVQMFIDLNADQVNSSIYAKIYDDLSKYCHDMYSKNLPAKILVTYDSYRIVKEVLNTIGIFNTFYTVIDEFQAILTDSRFKASTELNFMKYLLDVNKVYFVSATPMLEKYIQMLDDFKNLPYYKLNWEILNPSRVIKPNLVVKTMQSIGNTISEIVREYISGNFEKVVLSDFIGGITEKESREAVFYVNSVNHIINIIRKCGLKPEQVNILCARTPENEKRIKSKLGKGWLIGKVPLKNESRKMFTFCTRTVYLGADFYSDNARTFIFSDSNSDCLAVDVSLDLPQILGRQRLPENPWKNSATFYYKATADWRHMDKQDFDNFLQSKLNYTKELLDTYNEASTEIRREALIKSYQTVIAAENYRTNYIGLYDNKKPAFNNLVYVSDLMAFDVQQVDYKDRFTVFSRISDEVLKDIDCSNFVSAYSMLTQTGERVKMLCEEYFKNGVTNLNIILNLLPDDDKAKSYYITLGPEKCRAKGYNVTDLKNMQVNLLIDNNDDLTKAVLTEFKENERVTKAAAKERLAKVYQSVGYSATAKASDLNKWFILQKVKLGIINGKQLFGIKLSSYKI